MYRRSHLLTKCLTTPIILRSGIQNDAFTKSHQGCFRCRLNTLVYHTFKCKNKTCDGVGCSSVTCSKKGFSLSPLLYLNHSYSNNSSKKPPTEIKSNKEATTIIQPEKLLSKDDTSEKWTPALDKESSSILKSVQPEDKIGKESVMTISKELGTIQEKSTREKIEYKEPVILPENFKKETDSFDLVQKLGLIERDVAKKPISVDTTNLVSKSEAKEKVLKALSEKEIELQKDGVQLNLGDIINVKKTETKQGEEVKPVKEKAAGALLEKARSILLKTSVTLKPDDGASRKEKGADGGAPPKKRQTFDYNRSSLERNFITPVRAMRDFMLKSSDLEALRKTKRRSPYENDPPIVVHWRKDVENKAMEVWGSKENLLKELMKRDLQEMKYQQNIFTVKRRLRDYRREQKKETERGDGDGLFGASGRVVLTAIAINGTNFLFKLTAWFYTGSHSMFSEAIHSLADTINQCILAYGIHKSVQRADSDHPYGYANMRYVSSLISGVGIFCVGSGLSMYHGFVGLTDPSPLQSFFWAFFILGGSLASEGATLLVAFNSIRTGAKMAQMTFSEYVWRGHDPSVNVVLLEDLAAVLGVGIAGTCMGLSVLYESHVPDAVGSLLVGGLLAGVASFIIYTNTAALVGRSIPQERLDKINAELESDVMIRAIHDVKGIDMGNSLVRYKAEMDFDGAELTRSYLDKQDLNQILEEIRKIQTVDDLEQFMLKHGENIVDMMGGEIDRIEMKLRKKHPEIRHCDLEIL